MLPDEPMTRTERYLARLAGQDVSIPDTPITREEQYLAYIIQNGGGVPAPNAGAHNSIFRGKNLGSTYTQAQADAIDAGTFDGLFLGDYWSLPWGAGTVKFRIAGFDVFYDMFIAVEEPRMKHHIVIVPDSPLGDSVYHEPSPIAPYASTKIKTVTLEGYVNNLTNIFNGGVLEYPVRVQTSSGGSDWIYSKIDLITQIQLWGTRVYVSNVNTLVSISQFTRFPLFAVEPHYIMASRAYWIGDSYSSDAVVIVAASGRASTLACTATQGVRPYFCLGKAPTP